MGTGDCVECCVAILSLVLLTDGTAVTSKVGLRDGFTVVGTSVGISVATKPIAVGDVDGLEVGLAVLGRMVSMVGQLLGIELGLVGTELGLLEGPDWNVVGLGDGIAVGVLVFNVGLMVGHADVGVTVGLLVGDALGAMLGFATGGCTFRFTTTLTPKPKSFPISMSAYPS